MKSLTPTLLILVVIGVGVFMASHKAPSISSTKKSIEDVSRDKLIPGLSYVFADEIIDGPRIDRRWNLPEGISLRMVSEDVGERIRAVRFVVSSPGHDPETGVSLAQDHPDKHFYFRNAESFKGVFTVDITNWVDFQKLSNTASGVKVRCSYKITSESKVKVGSSK